MSKIYAECLFENSETGSTNSVMKTVVGGIAPKSCKDLNCEFDDNNDVLKFTWKDVDDTYWGGVRLVVKKDSAPENFEDGIFIKDIYTINAYSTTPLEVPIEDSGTYYATLFPFSTTGCVNSLKVSHVDLSIVNTKDPVSFEKDDWDMIKQVLSKHKTSTYYHVGDTKHLTCSDGNTYTMEIVKITTGSGSDPDTLSIISKELCPTPLSDTISNKLYSAQAIRRNTTTNTNQNVTLSLQLPSIKEVYDTMHSLIDILPENVKSLVQYNTTKVTKDVYKIMAKEGTSATIVIRNGTSTNTAIIGNSDVNIEQVTYLNLPTISSSNLYSGYNKRKYIINTNTYGKYLIKANLSSASANIDTTIEPTANGGQLEYTNSVLSFTNAMVCYDYDSDPDYSSRLTLDANKQVYLNDVYQCIAFTI